MTAFLYLRRSASRVWFSLERAPVAAAWGRGVPVPPAIQRAGLALLQSWHGTPRACHHAGPLLIHRLY